MKFWEAMKALEEGKKVRCAQWPNNCYDSQSGNNVPYSCYSLSHWSQESWELYEEPELLLTFAEVVKGLKEGKRFRRERWVPIAYIVAGSWPSRAVLLCEGSPINLALEDFEACDWVEVK